MKPRKLTWEEKKKLIRKSRYLYLLLVIPTIYYILFHYLPMYGVIIAFKNYNVGTGILKSRWVGGKWFLKFLKDAYFWKLVRNTLLLNIYNLLWGFPVPILLALMVDRPYDRHNIYGKGAIQPTLWEDQNGLVHMFLRTTSSRIFRSDSSDGGRT